MSDPKSVGVGDRAPDFTLPAAGPGGGDVSLADFLGKSEVVLYFYPKAGTPVCTAEACSFRDSYEAFRDAGAEVIGVSADAPASLGKFAARNRLPFVLLSDPGGEVRGRYGVPKTLGVFPGRTTYLIDRAGVVRHVFSSQVLFARHVTETLAVLRALRAVT